MAQELFGTPKSEPSMVSKIGAVLGGFGAGVQGKGQEYLTGIQERRAEEEKKRLAAMVKDAKQAYDFLNRCDVNNAMSLIQDRVQMIGELGGDPSDTARIGAMIASGSTEEAKNQLETFLRPFMPTEVIKANEITDSGQIMRRNPLTGEITAEDVAGFRRSATEPSTVQALRYRATQAGLEEGTPEYQEFMRSGGGGSMEGSSGITKYKNGVAVQYLGAGMTRVLDPIRAEITDPTEKQNVIEAAIASGPAEAGAIATATETAKGNVARGQEVIDSGRSAAQAIPAIKSSLVLLDRIATGGVAGLGLRIRRALGGENADEGELAYNLRKQVLQQLKPTFGAAFTAREGDLLREIEASESRSTEANVRLLSNLLEALQLDAEIGRSRALGMEDTPTVREIDSYLNAQLGANASGIFNEIYQEQNPPEASGGGRVRIRVDAQGNVVNE